MSRLPGIFEDAGGVDSDDWYTPYYVIEALGLTYDLDPCAPPGGVPWIPAAKVFTEANDGLTQFWVGRVWLNPPYSNPWMWVRRLKEHGNGIALVPADTASAGWADTGPFAEAVCFLRHRVTFVRLGNDNVTSARFPSALLAWGDECAQAVRSSGLGWVVK